MRGAVAAGHPLTAQAGARVLEAGGNAVDAAVAAALVSWVTESPLTGPGAGGFMLVHRARDRSTRVFDFFVSVPGLGLDGRELTDMDRVDVDFSGGSTQTFHIGAASCAVPGAALGLEEAHRSFGSLPWPELFGPAIDLARNGVRLNDGQAYLHRILDLILRHTPEARAVYERDGEPLGRDDPLVQTDLAGTLELIAEHGARVLYDGKLGRRISEHVRSHGGCLTNEDLETYRIIRRRPVTASFCGEEYLTNPPPSAGGILIAYGLPLLEELGPGKPGTAEAIDALARVMREQAHARVAARTVTGGLAHALEERAAVVSRGTTHISVVDGLGDARWVACARDGSERRLRREGRTMDDRVARARRDLIRRGEGKRRDGQHIARCGLVERAGHGRGRERERDRQHEHDPGRDERASNVAFHE